MIVMDESIEEVGPPTQVELTTVLRAIQSMYAGTTFGKWQIQCTYSVLQYYNAYCTFDCTTISFCGALMGDTVLRTGSSLNSLEHGSDLLEKRVNR